MTTTQLLVATDGYMMSAEPNTNFAFAPLLSVGAIGGKSPGTARAVMFFNISAIPQNAIVTSAILSVQVTNGAVAGTSNIQYRRIIPPATQAASHNQRDGLNDWTTPGCGSSGNDYYADSTVAGSPFPTSTGMHQVGDPAAIFQAAIAAGDDECGVLAMSDDEGDVRNIEFYSRNSHNGEMIFGPTVALVWELPPDPPVITSDLFAAGTVGEPFEYEITATNSPTSYNATGLHDGLSINTSTGVIDGTPTEDGEFGVEISATNAGGSDTETLVVTIAPASDPAGRAKMCGRSRGRSRCRS